MKKSTKSMLVSALILFLTGIIISLSAAVFVKIRDIDAVGMEHPSLQIQDKTVSLEELLSVSANSNFVKKLTDKEFTKVSLNIFSGDILVQYGDETSISFSKADLSNLSYEISGETLTVSEKNPVGLFGVYMDRDGYSFHGLRQIFAGGNTLNTKKKIVLTIEDDTVLENFEIHCGIGSVEINSVEAINFTVRSYNGNVNVTNVRNTDTKLNLVGDTTNFSIQESIYASCNITTKIGNISAKIPSELCKSTVLSSWLGNVDIFSDVPTNAFKLTLESVVGSVYKNGVKEGKSLKDSSQNANRITAETILGKVSLSFLGEDEDSLVAVDTEPKTEEAAETVTEEPQTVPNTEPVEAV